MAEAQLVSLEFLVLSGAKTGEWPDGGNESKASTLHLFLLYLKKPGAHFVCSLKLRGWG